MIVLLMSREGSEGNEKETQGSGKWEEVKKKESRMVWASYYIKGKTE